MTEKKKQSVIADVLIPLFLLLGITVFFRMTDSDLALERLFYDPAAVGSGWIFSDAAIWKLVYNIGNYPALLLTLTAIAILILGYWKAGFQKYRKITLFILITIALGPGLLVNAVFKDHWGRPRPRQVIELGGKYEFLPVWTRGVSGRGKSFPCGHCSMGYFFFVPFFFLRGRRNRAAAAWLAAGLGYGTLMGVGRMVQGAHFASDVLWAGGMVYLSGLGVYYAMNMDRDIYWSGTLSPGKKRRNLMTAVFGMLAVALILSVMLATPYFQEKSYRPHMDHMSGMRKLVLEIEDSDIELGFGDWYQFDRLTRGFGLPGSTQKQTWKVEETEKGLTCWQYLRSEGWFTEIDSQVKILVPDRSDLESVLILRHCRINIYLNTVSSANTVNINAADSIVRLMVTEDTKFILQHDVAELTDETGMGLIKKDNTVRSSGDDYRMNISISSENSPIKIIRATGRPGDDMDMFNKD